MRLVNVRPFGAFDLRRTGWCEFGAVHVLIHDTAFLVEQEVDGTDAVPFDDHQIVRLTRGRSVGLNRFRGLGIGRIGEDECVGIPPREQRV